jgi:hypothetical protein
LRAVKLLAEITVEFSVPLVTRRLPNRMMPLGEVAASVAPLTISVPIESLTCRTDSLVLRVTTPLWMFTAKPSPGTQCPDEPSSKLQVQLLALVQSPVPSVQIAPLAARAEAAMHCMAARKPTRSTARRPVRFAIEAGRPSRFAKISMLPRISWMRGHLALRCA